MKATEVTLSNKTVKGKLGISKNDGYRKKNDSAQEEEILF